MIAPFLLLAVALADFSGEWRGTVADGSQTAEMVFDLHQSGDRIAGTMSATGRTFEISSGAAHGPDVELSVGTPANGRLTQLKITGKLEGESLRLNMQGASFSATRAVRSTEAIREERLAGLMRAWGTIKFFHPYLAYRPIDWDAALMAAIPKVEAAKSAEEYSAAVASMLQELKDPETHVLRGAVLDADVTNPAAPAGKRRRLVRSGYYPQIGGTQSGGYYADWEIVDAASAFVIRLPEKVRIVMRTGEPVTGDTALASAEATYGSSLPPREQRLLALARYWNTIRYFYGYLESLQSWDTALGEAIPDFESAKTWHDYVFAVTRLAAKTHDSHSIIFAFWREFAHLPDVMVGAIEGQSVVKSVGAAVKGLAPGDVVVAVNGEDIKQRRQAFIEVDPHSTPQAGLYQANQFLLGGPEPEVQVKVRKADGSEAVVTLLRSGSFPMPIDSQLPVYGILPSGFGYMDMGRLETRDLDSAVDRVVNAPGLIVDMRGYPRSNFQLASYLTDRLTPAAAIHQRIWHGPDPALSIFHDEVQSVIPRGRAKYKGRVAVLIHARSMSAAEHLCLHLEAATDATFIGSPTRGAEGEVTNTVLPGGIQVNFSGTDIRHADGRPVQRVGILPDIWIEPTIAGIREGRDEVLDRAVEFLRSPK